MNQLPIEVASTIFAEACFDDEVTGCALTLTSKWIGEVAMPVRFQAVSLYGIPQIRAFSRLFEKMPSGTNIKHLFLSGIGPQEAGKRRAKRFKVLRKLATVYKLLEKSEEDKDDSEDEGFWTSYHGPEPRNNKHREKANLDAVHAFHSIILRAATSIETLFLSTMPKPKDNLVPTFPCPLPHLVECSVTDSAYDSKLPGQFPSLKCIHVETISRTTSYRDDTPALQELRANIYYSPRKTTSVLDDILDHAHSERNGMSDPRSNFPSAMKRVILQQTPPAYGGQYGNTSRQHTYFMGHLDRVAADVNELKDTTGFQLVLLPAQMVQLWVKGEINSLGFHFEDARRDWMVAIGTEKI